MKKFKFYSVVLACACVIMVSCSKNEDVERAGFTKPTTLIEKLNEINDAYADSDSPQTKGLFKFFKKVWNVVCADVASAYEVVMANPDEFSTVVSANNPWAWAVYGFKNVPTIAGASKKAYKEGCGLVEPLPSYESALLCMDYVANAVNGGTSQISRNGAVILGGGGFEQEYGQEIEALNLPLEYAWTGDLALGHNVGLEFFFEEDIDSLLEQDGIEGILDDISSTYGIDSTYYAGLTASLQGIGYNMNYSTFFNSNNTAENVMILYSRLYEQYVNSIDDVITITNTYMTAVADSEELSDEEKAALISALSVSAYSSNYWKNVLSDTE